jgi:selenocysteine lyase/cysteine desulfurase
MSWKARLAVHGFTELVGREPCSARIDAFLTEGSSAFPGEVHAKNPGLMDWHGISALKESLRTIAGAMPTCPVFLSSRSTQLMRLAARLLFRRCKRVLVSDLEWPAYQKILENEARRRGREIENVPLRKAVFVDGLSASQVTELLSSAYQKANCDGLFLSHVSFDGVRLPVREIVRAVSEVSPPKFSVVDGAQAFSHVPADLKLGDFDFYLAGCHKWLRAYHPMGVGFSCRQRSEELVRETLSEMMREGDLDDPLLRFTEKRERGEKEQYSETVSLSPLLASAGASAEFLQDWGFVRERFSSLIAKASQIAKAALGTGFVPVLPHPDLRSGVVLLREEGDMRGTKKIDSLRRSLPEAGISITTYENGLLRLSAPTGAFTDEDSRFLHDALKGCTKTASDRPIPKTRIFRPQPPEATR